MGVKYLLVVLLLGGCASHPPYTADSPRVLVEPKHRAWLKPDSTMEDENRARKKCGDELRSNEQLRKGPMTAWSDAYEDCMNRKGFRYFKKRKRSK